MASPGFEANHHPSPTVYHLRHHGQNHPAYSPGSPYYPTHMQHPHSSSPSSAPHPPTSKLADRRMMSSGRRTFRPPPQLVAPLRKMSPPTAHMPQSAGGGASAAFAAFRSPVRDEHLIETGPPSARIVEKSVVGLGIGLKEESVIDGREEEDLTVKQEEDANIAIEA